MRLLLFFIGTSLFLLEVNSAPSRTGTKGAHGMVTRSQCCKTTTSSPCSKRTTTPPCSTTTKASPCKKTTPSCRNKITTTACPNICQPYVPSSGITGMLGNAFRKGVCLASTGAKKGAELAQRGYEGVVGAGSAVRDSVQTRGVIGTLKSGAVAGAGYITDAGKSAWDKVDTLTTNFRIGYDPNKEEPGKFYYYPQGCNCKIPCKTPCNGAFVKQPKYPPKYESYTTPRVKCSRKEDSDQKNVLRVLARVPLHEGINIIPIPCVDRSYRYANYHHSPHHHHHYSNSRNRHPICHNTKFTPQRYIVVRRCGDKVYLQK